MPRRWRGAPGSQASPPPGWALRRLNGSPPPRPPSRFARPKGSMARLPNAFRSRHPHPANGCIRWLSGSPSFRRIARCGLSLQLRSMAARIRHHCASAHKPDAAHRACKIRIRPDNRRSSGPPNESSCPAPAVTGKERTARYGSLPPMTAIGLLSIAGPRCLNYAASSGYPRFCTPGERRSLMGWFSNLFRNEFDDLIENGSDEELSDEYERRRQEWARDGYGGNGE